MYYSRAFAEKAAFEAAVARAAGLLAPQVVDLSIGLGEDMYDEPSVFFEVLIADENLTLDEVLEIKKICIHDNRPGRRPPGQMGRARLLRLSLAVVARPPGCPRPDVSDD